MKFCCCCCFLKNKRQRKLKKKKPLEYLILLSIVLFSWMNTQETLGEYECGLIIFQLLKYIITLSSWKDLRTSTTSTMGCLTCSWIFYICFSHFSLFPLISLAFPLNWKPSWESTKSNLVYPWSCLASVITLLKSWITFTYLFVVSRRGCMPAYHNSYVKARGLLVQLSSLLYFLSPGT